MCTMCIVEIDPHIIHGNVLIVVCIFEISNITLFMYMCVYVSHISVSSILYVWVNTRWTGKYKL